MATKLTSINPQKGNCVVYVINGFAMTVRNAMLDAETIHTKKKTLFAKHAQSAEEKKHAVLPCDGGCHQDHVVGKVC